MCFLLFAFGIHASLSRASIVKRRGNRVVSPSFFPPELVHVCFLCGFEIVRDRDRTTIGFFLLLILGIRNLSKGCKTPRH
jgi:hypothetical protein